MEDSDKPVVEVDQRESVGENRCNSFVELHLVFTERLVESVLQRIDAQKAIGVLSL